MQQHVTDCEICGRKLDADAIECIAPHENYVRPSNRWERVPECLVLCIDCLEECRTYWEYERYLE